MKEVTATGQSVEAAVESALAQLQTTRDRTEISIVEEGKKGFFGIFGSRPAVVRAVLKPDPIEEAVQFLKNIGEKMGAPVEVEVRREGKEAELILSGEKIALFIGKRGQTLNSLQYLTQLVVNKSSDSYLNVVLDAEDYRKRRNDTLIQLAQRLAQKAVKTGKDVALEPMPSYERKIIHAALAGTRKVKTYSSGADPNRHIVISPVK
ncbi:MULTISPECIES: RNA-binding cell elongation regulator Jag/EloR [Bacillaceae]|uniref:RNA-binding protein KhpB n=2 Tax=Bacillus infantis TaxID=324767 RepID=U5LK33_9BACI|nr:MULTISPECIES: RNA-binding cell elongation regulator Jag/EloR [Bacillus]OXT17764.1 protein jag [Bacillus sp. OG2]AGX07027.1 protein jag [Bacillus infantis NRRL B-14911]EAR63202.1 SpoIIIJ-associated protein [Bacillus sp. NRRL B-14911]MCK6208809.1 protein jag [Bacillus infantis]MCP1161193.1 protein jag [Bacillus infantis]